MDEEIKIIVFNIMEDEYGLEIEFIQEIRKMRRITRIPQAPDFVAGVIKIRGRIIPLIDFRKRMGLPFKEYGDYTKIIIVNLESHILGVIVDMVSELLTIPEGSIDHPDSVLASVNFLKGVGNIPGRMVLIVDMDKVLSFDDKKNLGKIQGCENG